MLVEQIMQSKLLTVAPAAPLSEALDLMRERGVRHLLVMEGERLVGIVSDRDLKRAMPWPTSRLDTEDGLRLPVCHIMTREVITIPPNAPVEDAARLLVREKISALPVTLEGRLLGLVTETDILELFVRALGAREASSRLDVRLGPGRSSLAEVVRIVEGAGTSVSSIMTLVGPDATREVVIRMPTINPLPVVRALDRQGYAVTTPWRR